MAADPITIEQAQRASEDADFLKKIVESTSDSEFTPNGVSKKTISGMNKDVRDLLTTYQLALDDSIVSSGNSATYAEEQALLAEGYKDDAESSSNASEGFSDAAELSSLQAQEHAVFVDTQVHYKGLWNLATGASDIPASWFHNGENWQQVVDITDITLSEPSTANTDFKIISNELQLASLVVNTSYTNIMYTTDVVTPITGFLFDSITKKTYPVPPEAIGKFISTFASDVLTTSDSSEYTLEGINLYSSILDIESNIVSIEDTLTSLGNTLIQENYLKPNQNLNVPYGDAVLPNAIAEDYTAGDVFAYDYEAVTDIVGLTRTVGLTSGTSGTYMRSYKGDFSSSFFGVQQKDGTVSQTGVDIDYNVRKTGYTTVAVNIATAPDHYCVALSPAEGRVAVINDTDSWNSACTTILMVPANYVYIGDEPDVVITDANLPDAITKNSRYVLGNYFGLYSHVETDLELLNTYGGWISTEFVFSTGGYGAVAKYNSGEGIIIQTGQISLRGVSSADNGGSYGVSSESAVQLATSPCRIWCSLKRK